MMNIKEASLINWWFMIVNVERYKLLSKNELIYLPSGTDIFKKLVDCIRSIKEELIKVKPQECSVKCG